MIMPTVYGRTRGGAMPATNPDIRTVHISELKPDPENARRHNPRNVGQIERSISTDGFGRAGLLAEDLTIAAGNATADAAASVGMEEVIIVDSDGTKPVYIRRTDLKAGSTEFRRLALSDNRAAELADWDADVLQAFLDDGLDLEQFWFPEELAEVLAGDDAPVPGLTDPDEVPDVLDDPITKPGDLWLLGEHRIGCIDSTDIAAVETLLGESRPDLVLTDPPYGVSVVKDQMVGADFGVAAKGRYAPIIGDETNQTAVDAYNLCAALRIPRMIFWGGNYYADSLPSSGCWLVWDKRGDTGIENTFADCELAWTNLTGPARIYRQLWNGMIREGEHETRIHPTQKPVGLMHWCVERYSDSGGVVLDLFLGSGATLIACEELGRTCVAAEMSPAYVDACVTRWERFTGNTATRETPALHDQAAD